jgi:competence protein ComEC
LKRRPALLALISYVAGIILGNYLDLSTFVLLFLILISLFLLFFLFQEENYRISLIVFLLMLAGFWRYELKSRDFPLNHISHFTELYGKVKLRGTISRDPDIREDKTFLEVNTRELSFNQKNIKTTGKILLKIKQPTNRFNYGDLIQIYGYLYSPFPARNPGAFDYRKYLNSKEIFGCMNLQSDSEVEILDKGEGNLFISKIILPLRSYILNSFKRNLSGTHQAILSGFVLGERRGIPKETYKLFTDTGTLHLLAISGSNVALVVIIFFGLFRLLRIPYKISLLLIFPLILIFSNVTGNQPSVVRASLMTSFFLLSLLIERERDLINIWALAALTILLITPSAIFDVGFQLSFAATLGLIIWVPRLEKLFLHRLKSRFLKYYMALPFFVSLSAQFFTYPIIAYYFNNLPVYSLLANLLIVPITGLVVMVGVISLLAGLLNFQLSLLFTSFNWLGLDLIIKILSFFSSLPYAVLKIPSPSYVFILIFYLLLLATVFQKNLKRFGIAVLISTLFLMGLSSVFNLMSHRTSELKITYLSAGGEAVLVEIPHGEKILINLAENPWEVERIILPFLYSKGITELDGLILTDEKGLEKKLPELLREIKISQLWVGKESSSILKMSYSNLTEVKSLEELNQTWSEVKVFSIYPDKNSGREGDEKSPLLMLSYGEFKLLLTENFLPGNFAMELKPDIVSFNPQGENLDRLEDFILNEGQAKGFILSGYKKLKDLKVKRGKVFQTSRAGAVLIKADKEKFQIRTVLGKRRLSQSL